MKNSLCSRCLPAATAAILSAALLLPSLAAAQSTAKPAAGHSGHTGMVGNAPMPAHGMDMKAMMKDMNDKMAAMPMSGDPDVDFAVMMRIHHVGAVDMAEAQLRDGKDVQMRKMARDIIAAQKREIAQFDKFLASRGHAHGAAGK